MELPLSQKERMLLEDQKKHEQLCIEKYNNYANQAKDPQLKQIFNANAQSEKTHLDSINQMLNATIPQMNQQQNQNQGKNTNTAGNLNNTQAGGANISDADLCTDMLMTEKYVSGAYNTSIFEFRDTAARDVLNHIQKEEQKYISVYGKQRNVQCPITFTDIKRVAAIYQAATLSLYIKKLLDSCSRYFVVCSSAAAFARFESLSFIASAISFKEL